MQERKIAIIDLGSNSVRMNIYLVEGDFFKLIDQGEVKVRISEGMGEELTIKEVPLSRLLSTLTLFREIIDVYQVDEVYPIATAAVRTAKNQAEILKRIKKESGFEFEVISGMEEAKLDYLGVINSLSIKDCVIIDLGGGSTEIVLVKDRKMVEAKSFPFGSVNITENTNKKKEARTIIREAYEEVPFLKEAKGYPLVGLGGTIRTLAKMHRQEISWPIYTIHGYEMSSDDVKEKLSVIRSASTEELAETDGVSPDRVDILKRGILPFEVLMEVISAKRIIISMQGVRDGKLYKTIFKKKDRINNNLMEEGINQMKHRYGLGMAANLVVCEHAVKLYEALYDNKGKDLKKLLRVAAQLYDVGRHMDYFSSELHGFYILIQSDFPGLSTMERIKAAFIIAFAGLREHRLNLKPYLKLLNSDELKELRDVSLFLALAMRLERTGSHKISEILQSEECLCLKHGASDIKVEKKASEQVIELLEERYGKKIDFCE